MKNRKQAYLIKQREAIVAKVLSPEQLQKRRDNMNYTPKQIQLKLEL